ncbi:MAG: hypothetical protein E6Q97_01355 [Desulfurellales bacterium]|nr:MAG: hypothetical protein E6Q97_01355 [Desulfurellales bacterium]
MRRKIATAAAIAAAALAGGVAVRATRSERAGCVMRPRSAAPVTCLRRSSDGGVFDFGSENVMPAADAVGSGCVEAPCVVSFGAKP